MGCFLIPERKAESEMIKIIKPGYKKEIECQKCGALLSYDEKEDVKNENIKSFATNCVDAFSSKQSFIICPQCHNKVFLTATR